ncbi:MAG: tryptophan synthase subunit alpha [Clostridiales bacterium]|jgi:tryptophan synthase alpha chain|nr:tryptophan synthase subunit alpha [Clostridiales bacterium]
MSNIKNAFKNGKAFIGFITGGDPSIDKSYEFILKMIEGGADLVEIGIPFSDPVAEGAVIQSANMRALKAGASTEKIFGLVGRVREKSAVPIALLTYLNPVFCYGYERFFKKCAETGADGIIIPDMPFEERGEVADFAAAYGIDLISLIAPTSKERIKKIAEASRGFIYVVSSMGVTGIRSEITSDLNELLKEVRAVSKTPAAVGFGINTPEQAAQIAKIADGVIVGSAIVKIIGNHGENAGEYVREYVEKMKRAVLSVE